MKRSLPSLILVLAVLLIGVALPADAGDRAAVAVIPRSGPGPGDGLARLIACLRIVDLSPTQKSDIQAILDASKPVLQADADAIQAAAEKLRADHEAGAEKCVIGQDFLDLRASEKQLMTDVAGVRDQILAKLTDDQKKKLRGCLEAPGPTAAAAVEGGESQ